MGLISFVGIVGWVHTFTFEGLKLDLKRVICHILLKLVYLNSNLVKLSRFDSKNGPTVSNYIWSLICRLLLLLLFTYIFIFFAYSNELSKLGLIMINYLIYSQKLHSLVSIVVWLKKF